MVYDKRYWAHTAAAARFTMEKYREPRTMGITTVRRVHQMAPTYSEARAPYEKNALKGKDTK